MSDKKVQWPTDGWPYRVGWNAQVTYMAETSCGPVVRETPEEALMRRVRYAAAHPLKERTK